MDPPQAAHTHGTLGNRIARHWPALLLLVGLICPLLFSTWYTFNQQENSLRRALDLEFEQIGEVLANGLRESIWNLTPELGQPVIDSVMRDTRVIAVKVTSVAQGSFAQVSSPHTTAVTTERIVKPIVRDGEQIGEVVLEFDQAVIDAQLDARWREIYILGGLQAVLAFGVLGFVYWILWRREREQALREMNQRLTEEVAAKVAAEAALRKSEERYRVLALRLQELREGERTAVAREIHDELGQALTCLRIDLAWMMAKLPKNRKELHGRGRAMVDLVDTTVNDVRRIASNLRPAILDDLGLAAAIEWMANEFEARTGIQCLVDVEDLELSWCMEANTAAFRIVQEALTNVSRHASATKTKVSLTPKGDEFELDITDDGIGISDTALSNQRSLGLLGMHERAAALGWRLVIARNLGAGTKVVLRIPYPPQQAPADKKPLKEHRALF